METNKTIETKQEYDNLAEISFKLERSLISKNEALDAAYTLGKSENVIETLLAELRELTSNSIFVEYYSHVGGGDCYKILNEYTGYREEKLALCNVKDGFHVALKTAVAEIKTRKEIFYKQNKQ